MSSRWIRAVAARLLPHKSAQARRPKRGLRLESLESRYTMNVDLADVTPAPIAADLSAGSEIVAETTQDVSAYGGAAFEATDGTAAYGGDAYGGDPYGGDPYGGSSYGGDPYGGQAYNQAPVISGFQIVYVEGGDWGVQGRVDDDQSVTGRSLQLTGTLQTSLDIAADGTFFLLLEGSDYFSGTLCAEYTDGGGLAADSQWASFG